MIRKTLGRGLDALIDSSAAERMRGEVPEAGDGGASGAERGLMMVAVERIEPGPFQPRTRFDPERLAELARAIGSQGIVEPLIVRPRRGAGGGGAASYELIAGERRLRAARSIGMAEVPVIVRMLDDRAALELSLVENLAREELSAVEEGRAFIRLADEFAMTHEQIAARIGKSRPHITNAMRLMELPAEVLGMIERGELSAGAARPLLAIRGARAQLETARVMAEQGVTARGAEELAKQARGRRSEGGSIGSGDANLEALAETLKRALRRKVTIIKKRGRTPGRIELEYYDDDDLTALAAQLTELDALARRRP